VNAIVNTRIQLALVSVFALLSSGVPAPLRSLGVCHSDPECNEGEEPAFEYRVPSKPSGFRDLDSETSETANLAAPLPRPPDTAQSCTLRIRVDGFRNTRGNLGTILFRSPDGWPEDKDKAFRHGPAPIDKATSTAVAVWPDLPPGDYGVAVIHDENSNAKLDRNLIGVPKEGFGFANNPHVGLSAPPFQKAIVHVACPATDTAIHLQYK
jgi:uncharacterized protein (DUF2141 family)